MLCCSVAGIALQCVTRETLRKPADQGISGLLGQNTGSCDRCLLTVTADNGALPPWPGTEGQNTVNKHQLSRAGKPLERTQHGQLGRHPDAPGIHFSGRTLTQCPACGTSFNLRHQCSPPSGRESLAVSEAVAAGSDLSSLRQSA